MKKGGRTVWLSRRIYGCSELWLASNPKLGMLFEICAFQFWFAGRLCFKVVVVWPDLGYGGGNAMAVANQEVLEGNRACKG